MADLLFVGETEVAESLVQLPEHLSAARAIPVQRLSVGIHSAEFKTTAKGCIENCDGAVCRVHGPYYAKIRRQTEDFP